jgi:DNA-binding FadR family transcriptional regulator
MARNHQKYEFFNYLASTYREDASVRIPTLNDLSQELGVSVAGLREQLEVARALGFVQVRPRIGIQRLPYSFTPAVKQSISYALDLEKSYFDTFSDLRNHLETAYWYEAVEMLTAEDKNDLQKLLTCAWEKLRSPQIHIPHAEHRQLHLRIYSRLDNPFVMGILEAYWDAYEAVGLNMYAGYDYLQQVWRYHQKMVDDICSGDYVSGYHALVEHKDLLYYRPVADLLGPDNTETDRSETA